LNVKLRGRTVPVFDDIDDDYEVRTAEDLISYCARVSNPTNQLNFDTSAKLLHYCRKKAHWSIFEMADLIMEINTTRDIGRQILRHRFSYQEFSQRYASVEALDTWVHREARLQDDKNRQNSIVTDDKELQQHWWAQQQKVRDIAQDAYEWALKNGIAKEQARAVLPEGMTPTRMFMKGNLRSWITYCTIRKGPETQKEHRDIADECWEIVVKEFPFLEGFDIDAYRERLMSE
jgi:thymidylate synthase (FAD)